MSRELLTSVVVRFDPPNLTVELLLKFDPLTVSVKPGSPAVLLAGLIVLTVGIGLLTARVTALVTPPPGVGLNTVME